MKLCEISWLIQQLLHFQQWPCFIVAGM